MYIAHKGGLSTYSTVVKHLITTPILQFVFLGDTIVALATRQVIAINKQNSISLNLKSNATCMTKVSSTCFAVGFENSQINLYNLEKSQMTVIHSIDQKLAAIKGLVFFGNYIIAAVNGVGIFKWLYMHDINPESNSHASLVKIMPVTRGFQINAMIKQDNELLVGMSDCLLLKYEQTLGYCGYYQSS